MGGFVFFFKTAYKSMNSVNHGEKHSLSIIFLLRDDTYLILPFFSQPAVVNCNAR